jgi:microcystin-dependent protein
MAKLTLSDISNITGQETSAINTINNNAALVETAFENTLSRDGTSPNSMGADIDMNMHDILNVNNIDVITITVDGVPLTNELYSVGPQGPQGEQGEPGETAPDATTSVKGSVELAELSEALAGTPTGLAITSDIIKSIIDIIAPVGEVRTFLLNAAPSGWLELNGLTIGNASSGGTARANADTETLFTKIWQQTSVSDLPIYTSTGVLSSKGASASADFAASKRIALPNMRGEFARGWDNGRGIDIGRTVGSTQVEAIGPHNHTATTDTAGAHTHTITRGAYFGANGSGNRGWSSGDSGGTSTSIGTPSGGAHSHVVTVANNSGTENRPRNVAFLYAIRY